MELSVVAVGRDADWKHSAAAPVLDRLLSMHEVKRLTSLSKTTVYRRIKEGSFPRPRTISPGRVAWSALDLQAWREGCPCEARAA